MTKQKRRKPPRHACPLCAEPRPNPGLPLLVTFGIPTYWPPETALAVFELIDGMRDIVLAVYRSDLQDAARKQAQSPAERVTIPDNELPF